MDGRPIELTFLEFELLAHLLANPRRVHSRAQLMRAVECRPRRRTIDVHIARIRATVGEAHRNQIRTVRNVG